VTATAAAQKAAEDGALTAEEMAELVSAQALIFKVCNGAAGRALEQGLAAARKRVEDAQLAVEHAQQVYEPAQVLVDRLAAELAECERRAANIDQVVDLEADLAARIEARSLIAAFKEETESLRGRLRTAQQTAAPLIHANGEAATEAAKAGEALAELEEAIKLPFAHELGQATAPYLTWQLESGLWFQSLKSSTARAIIMYALAESGIGAEVETRAIEAYCAGDPSALKAGSSRTRMADGTTVIRPPDGPPIVLPGLATPQQRRNLRGTTVDSTPGSDVISQQWARSGYQRQPHAGLPGIHHRTEGRFPPSGGALSK
jgi:hypothetical protein